MVAGVVLAVGLVSLCAHWWSGTRPGLWMVAALAASSVLVIGMPSSPLAQPWPVLGGTCLSAAVGVICSQWIADPVVAAGFTVGLAVVVMLLLRCLHPPGASLSLIPVLDPAARSVDFLLFVLFDMVLLLLIGILYNHFTGRSYPHEKRAEAAAGSGQGTNSGASPFASSDLDAALKNYNQVLDISRADLEKLLHHAAKAAFQRTLGELRCENIMSSPVHFATEEMSLSDAWALMNEHGIKALPVVDGESRAVIGIVTTTDFMHHQFDLNSEGLGKRLRSLIVGRNKKAQTVGGLMTSPVQQARADSYVMELVPLFSEAARHHIPIVDERNSLVGIITQTDLLRALTRSLAT